jgi:hypothetical protein
LLRPHGARRDRRGGGFERLAPAREDHHVGAVRREPLRGGAADAGRTAGEEDEAAVDGGHAPHETMKEHGSQPVPRQR